MKHIKLSFLLVLVICHSKSNSQIQKGFFMAKSWSKEISLYRSKSYIMESVLGVDNNLTKFQVSPLAAANSGELTTLVYDCTQKAKQGLVLCFYGDYWNSAGMQYTGYQFKDIPNPEAIKILDKLITTINDNYNFLSKGTVNEFNISYQDADMQFLIYNVSAGITKIRVFWSSFDAEWDAKSLYKTKDMLMEFMKKPDFVK